MTELLPRSDPRAQGVDSVAIDRFVAAVDRDRLGLHGLMVVRHGHVVGEEWWAPYTPERPHLMYSASKAFTATAVGLAVAEGLLSLSERVLDILPSYGTARVRAAWSELQVRHLLTMASGHAVDTIEFMRRLPAQDWIELFFSVAPEFPPGESFLYDTGATYVLSAIVQSRTGQPVHSYLGPRLFEPLGIPTPVAQQSPRGIDMGGTGFQLRTEDLAAFGQLYLRGGVWNGTRLLPAEWVTEATSSLIRTTGNDNPDWLLGYGFKFWQGQHHSYRADGAFGQMSLVLPEQDTVVAMTAGTADMQAILTALWDELLPGLSGQAAAGKDLSTRRHRELQLPVPASSAASGSPGFIGTGITLDDSLLGLTDITVTSEEEVVVLRGHDKRGDEHVVRCGMNDWIFGESLLAPHDDPAAVPAVAGLVAHHDAESISLIWQFVQTPFRRTITIRSTGSGTVQVCSESDPAGWIGRPETVDGRYSA